MGVLNLFIKIGNLLNSGWYTQCNETELLCTLLYLNYNLTQQHDSLFYKFIEF